MTSQPPSKKLLDQMREALQTQHYSIRTENVYVEWVKRFILFHHKRHPKEMGNAEIAAFLTDLAVKRKVAASTQNQALSALLYLYREVLHQEVGSVDAVRARKPKRLPTVLSKPEVLRVISAMAGTPQLTPALAAQVQVWPSSCTGAACAPSSACACA